MPPRHPPFTWQVLVIVGVLLAGLVAFLLWPRTGPQDQTPVPTTPGAASPTAQWSDLTGINPGYRPDDPQNSNPFATEPRESRPPVARPDATPEQAWPSAEPTPSELDGWVEVDGGLSRGRYRIPAGWTYKDGLIMGYETMHQLVVGGEVSFDRDGQCQGDYWSAVLLQKVATTPADPADVTLQAARNWAQLRNTEWEGDYYEVPEPTLEPFTFDDGVEGSLATVSFVPMYSDEYSCNTPAIRFSVASRADGAGFYSMVAISHIGDPESLPQASERQILATLAPPR